MATMRAKGLPLYEKGDYNINTIGIRSSNARAGKFDDVLCQFYKVKGQWVFKAYKATTDPGLTYLQNPLNAKGCAIVVPGYYTGVYQLGTHKGFPALRQSGNLKVYRDNNRDQVLDYNPATIETGSDMFCNIHYSQGDGQLDIIGPWSAGCQVLSAGRDSNLYKQFLAPYYKASTLYGNRFSYGLLEEKDLIK